MNEIEYVEVTIKVPKKIADFLKIAGQDAKEYIEYSIKECCKADIEQNLFNEDLQKAFDC